MTKLGKSPRYAKVRWTLSVQKTKYVRKKFQGKRKWIPIGELKRNGDIDIFLTQIMMDALLTNDASDTDYYWSGMTKEQKKELSNLFNNKHVQNPVFCYKREEKCK